MILNMETSPGRLNVATGKTAQSGAPRGTSAFHDQTSHRPGCLGSDQVETERRLVVSSAGKYSYMDERSDRVGGVG